MSIQFVNSIYPIKHNICKCWTFFNQSMKSQLINIWFFQNIFYQPELSFEFVKSQVWNQFSNYEFDRNQPPIFLIYSLISRNVSNKIWKIIICKCCTFFCNSKCIKLNLSIKLVQSNWWNPQVDFHQHASNQNFITNICKCCTFFKLKIYQINCVN